MQRLITSMAITFAVAAFASPTSAEPLNEALSPDQRAVVSDAVDRGLKWLTTQQNRDGSFRGFREGAEGGAVTFPNAYATLAFLSRGHQPGRGPYGRHLTRGLQWLLSIQREDGSFSTRPEDELPFLYEHALAGLVLSEAYGFSAGSQVDKIGSAIERGLVYSRRMQQTKKLYPEYHGGWNYADKVGPRRAHLSNVIMTSWELTFMRSADNAGFKVPQVSVDEGLAFIERCYRPGPMVVSDRRIPVGPSQGVFFHWPREPLDQPSWANFTTTSTSMVAFQFHGRRDDARVLAAADWLAGNTVPEQGTLPQVYLSWYSTSRAMAQAGGENWKNYYPRIVERLLPHQDPDGHWRLDRWIGWGQEIQLGPAYYTALAVLCLTLQDQLLPIHQR